MTQRPQQKSLAPGGKAIALALLALVGGVGALMVPPPAEQRVGEQPGGGSHLVSTNQTLTPVGVVRRVEGARPKDVALSPDKQTAAVLAQGRVLFFAASAAGEERGEVKLEGAGPLGLAWLPDGSALFASLANGRVARLVPSSDGWKAAGDFAVDAPRLAGSGTGDNSTGGGRRSGDPQIAGLAVAPDGRRLYVALGIRNAVAVVALPEGKVEAIVPVGAAPYQIALSPDGKTLLAANRGGRAADGNEPSAPSAGTLVRVDARTDAAQSGSVSVIDTATLKAAHVEAGRQPGGIAFSADGATAFIANADDDSVTVLDVPGRRVIRTLALRQTDDQGWGRIPTDVALGGDGKTLYVSCGGINAVAVLDVARGDVRGYLPTGWFPIALANRGDGTLIVASSKGLGSRVERRGKETNGIAYGVHGSVGTVQFIPPQSDLEGHSRQVAANNRWGTMGELAARRGQKPVPLPERVGEPSLFKHVVFIIKENHTYDSILGDIAGGNGDPSLCLFGENITPNHHALAREFVLLDNTYTSGTNSADGHQWTVSAVANGYSEQNYGAHARSYPYDGGDPLAYSPEGFLWTAALQAKKRVRVYGEFVNKPRITDTTTGKTGGASWTDLWQDYKAGAGRYAISADTDNAALKPLLHPRYIGFPSTVSDQWRADQFLADLAGFEKTGGLPDLSILLLPNDHTMGTRPGAPTPRAAVADNDLALGRIVEGLTRSRFWPDLLILVIEDDSQLGLDHVDGHRTVAFCVSPYTRRGGAVVRDTYNHTSFARTMGLVLGFPALHRFDRTATPLTACFTDQRDLRSYTHRPNRVPLDEMNPPAQTLRGEARDLALASDRLDWSDVDRADASVVARAVWRAQHPNGAPFPWRHFNPNKDQ